MATSDAFNHISRQQTYGFAQAIYHVRKRVEHFIPEAHRADLLPNLFYGLHFRRVWWYRQKLHILWTTQ